MFIEYNPNPRGINTGDCVIRAICKAFDMDWEKVYMELTVKGLEKAMWGDTNAVWEKYLKEHGFDVKESIDPFVAHGISQIHLNTLIQFIKENI